MEIKVSVYNDKHRNELKKRCPIHIYKNIAKIDGKILEISREDFLIYSLFKEQRNHPGFEYFSDFRKKLPYRIDKFNDYLDENSNTITAIFDNAYDQEEVTVNVGIGAGLSVISHIHGLTEADWNIIPISKVKDLDYSISSDGNNIVEVECKGAFADPKKKTYISDKKLDIENKKKVQREDIRNENLLYGVITSYDNSKELAHCRILDPVSDNEYDSPWKLRLLSRLNFYLRELSLISKSHFLIALSTKLQVLRLLGKEEIERTDNLPLSKPDGEPFPFPISFEHKTRILDNSGFGDMHKVDENKYLFYGFRNEVVETLIKQNYSEIMDMKFPTQTINTQIKAKLQKRDVEQQLHGKVMQTSAGRLFGIFHYE
ncbi:hypothetical protein P9J64_13575 [Deltaproteobacteria bacterium IMCC39524]|nr:hypothetical protein [Deltaproteobacteria bacterium IMCC39524]